MEMDSEGVARLKAAAWLAPLVADPLECALELGSLAMAPTLRTLVNRPEVVKIRGHSGRSGMREFSLLLWHRHNRRLSWPVG